MNKLEYYENLPDFMEKNDIEKEIENLIFINDDKYSALILNALYELSSRLVDTYSSLSGQLKISIGEKIKPLWNKGSLESTEVFVGTIINFELYDIYNWLKGEVDSIKNTDVKREVLETFDELGSWGEKGRCN